SCSQISMAYSSCERPAIIEKPPPQRGLLLCGTSVFGLGRFLLAGRFVRQGSAGAGGRGSGGGGGRRALAGLVRFGRFRVGGAVTAGQGTDREHHGGGDQKQRPQVDQRQDQ